MKIETVEVKLATGECKTIEVEVFTTVAEALSAKGPKYVVDCINYAHSLMVRAHARDKMVQSKLKGSKR